jgi:hypothetical protein
MSGDAAFDPHGKKIGSVGQVYVNDQTGQPDWITVNTGPFRMKENFAPLAGASFNGNDLVLPFDKPWSRTPRHHRRQPPRPGGAAIPVRVLPAAPRRQRHRDRRI